MWLFTGHTLWEYVTVLFDNIPKVIYLIYTAVASCLDLLQHVMRKLAGLDTYWIRGEAYVQQDPVLEFIYGMLGIGEHAGIYSALSTVFWSIAIFGLIVLVIATMIAIIKSHYNEDTSKTNPLSYIYTAIKAIFTFAIVPVAVILGIYLSQFLLQTADNITAGAADEGTIRGIYGDNAVDLLVPDSKGFYNRYDYFGFGDYTTSTPISGMLFRVAAYEANRVRKGDYRYDIIQESQNGSNKLFGNLANKPADQDPTDYVAYQVDYAFMNNFNFKGAIWAGELLGTGWGSGYGVAHTLVSIAGVDFFTFAGVSDGFSKFNVGLVWYYYYLWKFNFFVGFASIIISFGLLTSIIIGLMSRLIYSAALFLIYPGTLGLAPLDDWNAFKSWRKEFTSQILMAFGSIIGMNIIFLILPYVNEFTWFNWGAFALPNTLINSLIIITGLLLVKEFITFLSGLIGSKSAADTGENAKKGLTSTLGKAGKATLGAANIAWKTAGVGMRMGAKTIMAKRAEKKVGELDTQIGSAKGLKGRVDSEIQTATEANELAAANLMQVDPNGAYAPAGYKKAFDRFQAHAQASGVFEGSDEYNRMKAEFVDNFLTNNNAKYKHNKDIINNEGGAAFAAAGLTADEQAEVRNLESLQTQRQSIVAQNYLDPTTGKADDTTATQIGRKIGMDIVGALLKGVTEGTQNITNIDFKAIKGVFGAATNYKYDEKGNAVGSYSGIRSNEQARDPNYQPSTFATIKQGFGSIFSAAGAPTPSTEPTGDKAIRGAAEEIKKAAADLKAATQNLKRFKP